VLVATRCRLLKNRPERENEIQGEKGYRFFRFASCPSFQSMVEHTVYIKNAKILPELPQVHIDQWNFSAHCSLYPDSSSIVLSDHSRPCMRMLVYGILMGHCRSSGRSYTAPGLRYRDDASK